LTLKLFHPHANGRPDADHLALPLEAWGFTQ